MSAMTVTLGADVSGLAKSMADATAIVSAAASKMASAVSKASGKGFSMAHFIGAEVLLKGLEEAFGAVKEGVGEVIAEGMHFLTEAVNKAAEHEQTQVSFAVLIGSAQKAEETLRSLREYTNRSGFDFKDITHAASELIVMGVAAEDVTDAMKMLGDVAAGSGAPIDEVAQLFAKVKVQGEMTSRELRRFTSANIPIFAELEKQFGGSADDIREMVKEGKIGFPEMTAALRSMTLEGGPFFQMVQKESQTTKGLFDTLHNAFEELQRALGEPINDALRPLLRDAIVFMSSLKEKAREMGEKIKSAITYATAAMKGDNPLGYITDELKLAFQEGVNLLIDGLGAAVTFFFAMMGDGNTWKGIGNITIGLANVFAAAMLSAFQEPAMYAKAANVREAAEDMKRLASVPGIGPMLAGAEPEYFDTDFDSVLKKIREEGLTLPGGYNGADAVKNGLDALGKGMPQIGNALEHAVQAVKDRTTDQHAHVSRGRGE